MLELHAAIDNGHIIIVRPNEKTLSTEYSLVTMEAPQMASDNPVGSFWSLDCLLRAWWADRQTRAKVLI